MNRDLYNEAAALPGASAETGLFGGVDREWRVLRDYPATHEDGAPAKVWVARYPAQFFRLTTGDVEVTTGSGTEMGELMIQLAEAVAGGMVGFRGFGQPEKT